MNALGLFFPECPRCHEQCGKLARKCANCGFVIKPEPEPK